MYDIAIIGGGVAGCAIAREFALQGISCVVIEKSSCGSGTSSRSSRLIHGGIRYLELAWNALKRGSFRESWKLTRYVFSELSECRIIENIAPNLAKPIPILIPIYKGGSRKRATVFLGSLLYFILARCSGKAKMPKLHFNAQSVLKILPNLKSKGLLGGITIWDRLTDDYQLVKSLQKSAQQHKANFIEHSKVESFEKNSKNNFEIHISNPEGKNTIQSRFLINASGPWLDHVGSDDLTATTISPIAGSHIMVNKFTNRSILLQAKDGRIFFCININDKSRIGTTERRHADPDTVEPTGGEIDYLIESLNHYFPDLNFTEKSILSRDAGVRPLFKSNKNMSANATSRDHKIIKGRSGAIHIAGVKLTDHRRAAEDVLNTLKPDLQKFYPDLNIKSKSAATPL